MTGVKAYRAAGSFVALRSPGYPGVRNCVLVWGEWVNRGNTLIISPPA